MKRFFDRNDTNKDGFLDRSELTDLDKRLKARNDKPKSNQRSRTAIPDSVHFETDVLYRRGE